MFSTGLVGMLFGDVRDSDLVKNNPIEEHYDISGTYVPTRAIVSGFGSVSRYAGGYFFVTNTGDRDVFDMPLTGGMKMIHIGENMWLQTSGSGANYFTYESVDADGNCQLEMMSMDIVQNNHHIFGTITYFGFALFGIICLLVLLVKVLVYLVRKIRHKEKEVSKSDKQITLQQAIQGISGMILFCMISIMGIKEYAFAVLFCITAVILALVSLVNGILLIKNTLKETVMRKKVKQYIWAAFCFGYVAVVVWFQLYNFINI